MINLLGRIGREYNGYVHWEQLVLVRYLRPNNSRTLCGRFEYVGICDGNTLISAKQITVQRIQYQIAEQHIDSGKHVEQTQYAYSQIDVFEHFYCCVSWSKIRRKRNKMISEEYNTNTRAIHYFYNK
jgi:hypothetical protein